MVTSVAFPLPVLRAEAAMAKAEKLAETDKRDAKQNGAQHLAVVRAHGDRDGADHGYGKKADFKPSSIR